jgi:type I restriction enzyme M protein
MIEDLRSDHGIAYWESGAGPEPLRDALKGASKTKRGTGPGKPEFVFESDDFLVIIEDKFAIDKTLSEADGEIDVSWPARAECAVNGAVHYARKIIENSAHYTRAFAIGITGSEQHNRIVPVFVEGDTIRVLPDLDSLDVFAPTEIAEFHRVQVLGELPREEREVREVRKVAEDLHEAMRNYGSLEGERKAAAVSAILLALRSDGFKIDDLRGASSSRQTDGWKIYSAAESYLRDADLDRNQKIGVLLDQIAFLREHPRLNKKTGQLGDKTPIRYFAEVLDREVLDQITTSSFDVLGNFYGEFVRYGGSDGNALGIVLTPHHVTTLMADLVAVNKHDVVIDPAAGTASFLIAAMARMFAEAGDDAAARESIRKHQLHGIELQDKLFAIGTTNMILRGDGKANFRRDNFFDVDLNELRGDRGFTKVLINPPYSQSKNKETRELSELSFIHQSLKLLNTGGRLAAIVPQSAANGKTKEDRALKKEILKSHTLDAVITMNPETFYGVGVKTVITLFTAGTPHPAEKLVKFIDFQRDGYQVNRHIGLVGDGTQHDRKRHLMAVLAGDIEDGSDFVVKSTVTGEDEWQHSYFYFNDQPPSQDDLAENAASYVAWVLDMQLHGNGSLAGMPDTEEAET